METDKKNTEPEHHSNDKWTNHVFQHKVNTDNDWRMRLMPVSKRNEIMPTNDKIHDWSISKNRA